LKKYAQNPEWLLGAEVESEIAFKEAELKNVATVKSAAELAEQELLENNSTVAFRLEKLNFHLHGGLKISTVIELSGKAGTGKTCFCLEAILGTLESFKNSNVLYISTECAFPIDRFNQMISDLSPEKQAEFRDRIVLKNSEHSDELKEMLFEKIPLILEIYKNQQRPIKMIVIDSITAVIRPDFKQNEITLRAAHMREIATQIKFLAVKFEALILVVNQVTENFAEKPDKIGYQDKLRPQKPALGLVWRNLIDEAIFISREEKFDEFGKCVGVERFLEVTKSMRVENEVFKFSIDSYGLALPLDYIV